MYFRSSVRARAVGPKKRCDYCGEDVVQSEAIRHVKEQHLKETFQCKLCLAADPTCFPYSETIKEMTSHMVMKHGEEVDSYYDHMIYPLTLYGSLCSNKECETKGGKVLAFDAATIGVSIEHCADRNCLFCFVETLEESPGRRWPRGGRVLLQVL